MKTRTLAKRYHPKLKKVFGVRPFNSMQAADALLESPRVISRMLGHNPEYFVRLGVDHVAYQSKEIYPTGLFTCREQPDT